MAINKLNIVDGIIQDKFIDTIPVKVQIVKPKGKTNVRTLIKMKECIGITNHNTGNSTPTAGDEMHANWMQNVENADLQYVSVHLFVDQDSITQVVPLDEVTYNAGDGKGDGNYKTISVEICENANVLKAEENAKKLNAALILTYPKLKIFKHQDWSGKFCPRVILERNGWNKFVEDINAYVKCDTIKSVVAPTKDVETVTIQTGVYGYTTAADAINDVKRGRVIPIGLYPLMIKHASGAWNIGKGYMYWINPKKVK
jgi:N-acetylmuramoyl-L-alanine amidase